MATPIDHPPAAINGTRSPSPASARRPRTSTGPTSTTPRRWTPTSGMLATKMPINPPTITQGGVMESERLVVNLTGAFGGTSAEVKSAISLPSAPTPKPLSAARRHIKPPDPMPLAYVQPTIALHTHSRPHTQIHPDIVTGTARPLSARAASPRHPRTMTGWVPSDPVTVTIETEAPTPQSTKRAESLVAPLSPIVVPVAIPLIPATTFTPSSSSTQRRKSRGDSRPVSADQESTLTKTPGYERHTGEGDAEAGDETAAYQQVPDNPSVFVRGAAGEKTGIGGGAFGAVELGSGRVTPVPFGSPPTRRPSSARHPTAFTTHSSRPPSGAPTHPYYFHPHTHYMRSTSTSLAVDPGDSSVAGGPGLVDVDADDESTQLGKVYARPMVPALARVQTVRGNLDRYRIEQIALRRLRFVIENNQAEPDHLALIDLVQQGQVPPQILHRYFGPTHSTPHALRILLLQSIDASSRSLHNNHSPTPTSDSPQPHLSADHPGDRRVEPEGRTPFRVYTPKPTATTPDEVLKILEQVERRGGGAAGGGGGGVKTRNSTGAVSAYLRRRPKSAGGWAAQRQGQGQGVRREVSVATGSDRQREREAALLEAVGTGIGGGGGAGGGNISTTVPRVQRASTAALSGEELLKVIERKRLQHLKL
ncbi:uncharacterized protein EV422DRAFT_611397 [Fimicolochytrium jonesii]|uniref:uncharacterized protein n=1 Tax=Fimicolochytrium jonesii TaxID=1396493 RepID=UPI0022FEB14F|nr:uncharacterized protein EV422DRAFT_611397 [Fimicolochytrium jonesii]KAI8823361.1 hypothetical protein EV422DRAFT_611397 [Fimicolochytrium jonesii]